MQDSLKRCEISSCRMQRQLSAIRSSYGTKTNPGDQISKRCEISSYGTQRQLSAQRRQTKPIGTKGTTAIKNQNTFVKQEGRISLEYMYYALQQSKAHKLRLENWSTCIMPYSKARLRQGSFTINVRADIFSRLVVNRFDIVLECIEIVRKIPRCGQILN